MAVFFNGDLVTDIPQVSREIINVASRGWKNLLQELSPSKLKELREAAYKAFDKSGLKDKGLDILNVTDKNETEVLEEVQKLGKDYMSKITPLQK